MRFLYSIFFAVAAWSLGACGGNPESPVAMPDASALPDPSPQPHSSSRPDASPSPGASSLSGSSPVPDASALANGPQSPRVGNTQDAAPGGAIPAASALAPGCTGAAPSFSRDVVPILGNCSNGAICHGNSFSYAGLVNAMTQRDTCSPARTLVSPGSLPASYVMNKLKGVGMCSGEQMPLGGSITATQVQAIADWICTGAQND